MPLAANSHNPGTSKEMDTAEEKTLVGRDGFKNDHSSEMEKGKKGFNSVERQLKARDSQSRPGNQLNGDDSQGEAMSYEDWYQSRSGNQLNGDDGQGEAMSYEDWYQSRSGNQLNGNDGQGEAMSYEDWYEEKEEVRRRL